MQIALVNGTIFTSKEKVTDKAIIIEHDIIKAIIESESVGENTTKIDCNNWMITAGLIDLQIYGGGGYLFSNEPSAKALLSMAEALVSVGTTGFYVTLASNSWISFTRR